MVLLKQCMQEMGGGGGGDRLGFHPEPGTDGKRLCELLKSFVLVSELFR